MASETRNCQNCKTDFQIEPEDFVFYEKMSVPPPTWCPECRLIRRMAFDNLKTIYVNICAKCHKNTIASLPPSAPFTVYCNTCWWSDSWNALDYGRDVDFSKPFIEQVKELMAVVPWMARASDEPTMENSDYTMNVGHLKNCYCVFHADFNEDCCYCDTIANTKDCIDCCRLFDGSELCYESVNLVKCYKALSCVDCENSNDIAFCRDCNGCSNCFGCVGLRNKQYSYFNEQLRKEEYERRIKECDHGSHAVQLQMRDRAYEFWNKFPRRYMHGRQNENVSGDYIEHSKNTQYAFQVSQCEDSKYCAIVGIQPTKDCYDYTSWGFGASRIYECMAVGEAVDMMKFCFMSWPSCSEIEYSMYAISSSNCFGCVGVRNKKYCILNKQYTKEEYESLMQKIKQHMSDMPYVDVLGRSYSYGEFFPTELSVYAYNESRGQEYFPLTKEETLVKGYAWREREERIVSPTLQSHELYDHIRDVPDSIVKEIIACEHNGACNDQCTRVFKIIAQELSFYKKMNIPLPRLCPNCRYTKRLAFRNPMKLFRRQCECAGEQSQNAMYANRTKHAHGTSPCPSIFQTAYEPEKENIIYCADCYQQEIN